MGKKIARNLTAEEQVERMFANSQTKLIVPILTLGVLNEYVATKDLEFNDSRIRKAYTKTVRQLTEYLGHSVHIGAKYYDAYGTRMSRYKFFKGIGHLKYRLQPQFAEKAEELVELIPGKIQNYIRNKLGVIPLLDNSITRATLAESKEAFIALLAEHISRTPANFEIFSFAVIKVHLEKFACKIYRDTRTAAHDNGVDISTNFGVVYQIKRLQVHTEAEAERLYSELEHNFDRERLRDGNIILVIDDISKAVKQYLINVKVQAISSDDIRRLAAGFDDTEDRQKVLRIVYDEFRREYSSQIT